MTRFQDNEIDRVSDARESLGEGTGSKDFGVELVIITYIGKPAKEQDSY